MLEMKVPKDRRNPKNEESLWPKPGGTGMVSKRILRLQEYLHKIKLLAICFY